MRLAVFSLLLFTCLGLQAQEIEKTYLRTDKDLYTPGDTLWFKAYVFNRYNTVHDKGLKINVFLVNQSGQKMADSSWPIYSGMSHGHVSVPQQEGRYHLVAYTPDMMNQEAEFHFNKEVFVRSTIADDVDLDIDFDQPQYAPGEAIDATISARLGENQVLANERFTYELLVNGEAIKKGRFRTDAEGKSIITDLQAPDGAVKTSLLIQKRRTELQVPYQLNVPLNIIQPKIDLQFLPEGGRLIHDLNSKVAFKANDQSGKPVDIEGVLVDQAGNVLDTVASYYKGMGSFYLRPGMDEYGFRIIEPAGIDSLYRLPVVVEEGATLGVLYQEEETLIKVGKTEEFIAKSSELQVLQHGLLVYTQPTKEVGIEFIRLPSDQLDMGVATLSLLGENGEVLSERLIFIGSQDQLKVDISLDQAEYLPRDQVKVKLRVSDGQGNPVQGNFSLAAIDDTHAPHLRPEFPNLMAQILLQSELKGAIPTPNFYFTNDERAEKALDLVMLTHGWRKYELFTTVSYEAITGQLVHKKQKKRSLGTREISIFDMANLSETVIKSDVEGHFSIPPSHFKYKGDSFLVAAKELEKKEKPLIQLDNDQKISHRKYKNKVAELLNSNFMPDYSIYLKENKVAFDRFRNAVLLNSVSVFGEGMGEGCEIRDEMYNWPWKTKMRGELDLTNMDPLVLIKQVSSNVRGFGNLGAWVEGSYKLILRDLLLSYNQEVIKREKPDGTTKLVYLPLDYFVLVNCESVGEFGFNSNLTYGLGGLDLSNVESISVQDPEARDNFQIGRPGIVFIKTIEGKTIYRPFSRKFFTYALKTEQEAEFYTPQYDTQEKRDLEIPDLRTTIHWEHSVITDEKGEADIEFYNADRDNRIRITVEGLGTSQRFGFAQKDYQVLMPASVLKR